MTDATTGKASQDARSDSDPLAVARRFVDALNACDVDAVREIYAPDVRIWHCFDKRTQTVEKNIETLTFLHRRLNNLNYDVLRVIPVPGGYVQQHVLRGELPGGEPFGLHACAIVSVENGRIVTLEEYLDTGQARPLYASS